MSESFLYGKASRTEASAAGLAARQYGLISRGQAAELGFTDKMIWSRVRNGLWVRVHAGVYRLAAVPEAWHGRLMAASLALGPSAVVSHRAAGGLWGLDGCDRERVELLFPSVADHPLPGVEVRRSRSLPVADRAERAGLPVTRPARTLIDLAAVVGAEDLEAALDSALRERLVTVAHVERRLAAIGSQGRAGAETLRRLLGERRGGRTAESRPENTLARALVAAGLPPPVKQFELWDGEEFVARFDCAYPDKRIAGEYDSYRHHYGRQAWRKDQARHNRATALGWLVFHITEADGVAAIVAAYEARAE